MYTTFAVLLLELKPLWFPIVANVPESVIVPTVLIFVALAVILNCPAAAVPLAIKARAVAPSKTARVVPESAILLTTPAKLAGTACASLLIIALSALLDSLIAPTAIESEAY